MAGSRGKFRSKPWDAVLAEARQLAESGVVELCLIAEDTNQYGSDRGGGAGGPGGGRGLAQLLQALAGIEGIKWIRLLYCYPSYWTDELIEAIATEPKVNVVKRWPSGSPFSHCAKAHQGVLGWGSARTAMDTWGPCSVAI